MILPLPETLSGIAQVSFEPQRIDYGAPEASGRQGGVQAGWPLWGALYQIDRSDPQSADEWRAFLARLRGRIRRFYAWDTTRPLPLAYAFGLPAGFDGAASDWSQSIDADGDAQLTLEGLPAGFEISLGDYVGFKWGSGFERRTMARAVLPATANGSGTAAVTVEPPLDTALVPTDATAHFDQPRCVMQLVPDNSELGPIVEAGVLAGGTIAAIQDLRP